MYEARAAFAAIPTPDRHAEALVRRSPALLRRSKSSTCRWRRCSPSVTPIPRKMIDPVKAAPCIPEAGTPERGAPAEICPARPVEPAPLSDTSYGALRPARQRISATPSDGSRSPVIPCTFLCPSSRARIVVGHPAHPAVAPGKRPADAKPRLALCNGTAYQAVRLPGNDIRRRHLHCSQLQRLGMDVQSAIETPRFRVPVFRFVSPHAYHPGAGSIWRVRIPIATGDSSGLSTTQWWPDV